MAGKAKKTVNKKATKKTTKKTEDKIANWLKMGKEGLKAHQEHQEAINLRRELAVPRYYMKPSTEGKVIFLDSEAAFCFMHEIWNETESRKDYVVCVSEFRPCPVCKTTGKSPVHTGHYTVIDCREVTRKDGTVSKFRKCLFPAKGTAIYSLDDLYEENKGLAGLIVGIKRHTKSEPTCGSQFKKLGKVTKAQLQKIAKEMGVKYEELIKPYDYTKVLALPTDEEFEILGYKPVDVIGSEDDSDESAGLDDLI